MKWTTTEVLVLVKVYPTPSNKYGETVCTAGITRDSKWIRLYPVPYRDLPIDKHYDKFQWIKVKVTPSNEMLRRPESHKIDASSIELLSKIPPGSGWIERTKYFLPATSKSLEEIELKKQENGTSLGAFKPHTVKDFIIESDSGQWNEKQLKVLEQKSLFNQDKATLRKVPYKFRYIFTCNNKDCKGHDIQIFDWEAAQSYWRFKKLYKNEALVLKKLKKRWLDHFFKDRESYFVVGTDFHWNKFMILTIVSPKRKSDQMELF
ncbi:MAG: hypothetical protein WC489_00615 [Patescibacteria group bacterium]